MLAVKIVLLAFWSLYAVGMGMEPWDGLNGFGKLMAMSAFVAVPLLYLLPTFEARRRANPDVGSITLLNALLGWSVLGWVAALVWAVKRPSVVQIDRGTPDSQHATAPAAATKQCPFCAETILAAAIKCKHCGSDLSGTVRAP